jgi:hypothetical protein
MLVKGMAYAVVDRVEREGNTLLTIQVGQTRMTFSVVRVHKKRVDEGGEFNVHRGDPTNNARFTLHVS